MSLELYKKKPAPEFKNDVIFVLPEVKSCFASARSRQQQLAQKKTKKAAQKAAEAAFAKAWAEQLQGLEAEEVCPSGG